MLGTTKHISEQTVKLFHFQNLPEETDQTTVLHFLEDIKKLKDSLCLWGQSVDSYSPVYPWKAPVNSSFLYTRILNPTQSFSYIRRFKLSHQHDLLEHPRKAFPDMK